MVIDDQAEGAKEYCMHRRRVKHSIKIRKLMEINATLCIVACIYEVVKVGRVNSPLQPSPVWAKKCLGIPYARCDGTPQKQ